METDSEINGSGVGLCFPSHSRGQISCSSGTLQKSKKGMERPALGTVTVQGWPENHGTVKNRPETTVQNSFDSSSYHLHFQEPKGLPRDAPVTAQHDPHCTMTSHRLQPHTTMFSPVTSPWATSIHHTGHLRSNSSHFTEKNLAPQAKQRGSGRHHTNTQVAKRSLSRKRIWGQCLQLECCWQA